MTVRVSLTVYFNPRPREEGDVTKEFTGNVTDDISIHALVKRATQYIANDVLVMSISIHALVKRATIYDKLTEMRAIISIHALVKRATRTFVKTV